MCYNHETTVHASPPCTAAGSAPPFYQYLSWDQKVLSKQGEGNMT